MLTAESQRSGTQLHNQGGWPEEHEVFGSGSMKACALRCRWCGAGPGLLTPRDPVMFDISTNALMMALPGLDLHEDADMSGIIRTGILSIDRGPHEAARAPGIPAGRALSHLGLP